MPIKHFLIFKYFMRLMEKFENSQENFVFTLIEKKMG